MQVLTIAYLLVAAGFGCLLVWAVARGMMSDIEEPKRRMLRREAELDHQAGCAWSEQPKEFRVSDEHLNA